MMEEKKLPISVLIMAQNEEANIGFAIESVINEFEQVIVVDSFSTDRTSEICKRYPMVEIYQHHFENWADQRNWMLKNCQLRNDIVFFLDADEYVVREFKEELRSIVDRRIPFTAIYVNIRFIFLGRHLKRAYGHPKIKRIFKSEGLSFYAQGAREYSNAIDGLIEMRNTIVHHDRKPISEWIRKHNNNSDREADLFFEKKGALPKVSSDLKVRLLARRWVWNKLPLMFRPLFYFTYRYFFSFGFWDGRPGFAYCFLHALWYPLLIDIKIREKMAKKVRK